MREILRSKGFKICVLWGIFATCIFGGAGIFRGEGDVIDFIGILAAFLFLVIAMMNLKTRLNKMGEV